METTITLQEADELRQIINNPIVGQDSRVSVSGADTSMGFLQAKLAAGANVSLTVVNPGGDESLRVDAVQQVPTPSGVDGRVLTETSGVPGWADAPMGLPTPTGVDGRVLTETGSVAGWAALPVLGETSQTTNLLFRINYSTGTDPVAGTVFTSQAEIDAYMLAHSITRFKTIMGCWDSLPDNLYKYVWFALDAGVHRPRVGEASGYPFYFGPRGSKGAPKWHSGYFQLNHNDATTLNQWEVMAPAQACTVATASNPVLGYEVYLEQGGAAYTPGALKGYYAWVGAYVYLIRDNDATKLYLSETYSGNPVGQNVTVISPGAIIRNSWDDLTAAYAAPLIRFVNELDVPIRFGTWEIKFDQYSSGNPIWQTNGYVHHDHYRILMDQSRLQNAGITQSQPCVYSEDSRGGQFWKCSFRGSGLTASQGLASFVQANSGFSGFGRPGMWTLNQCYIGGMRSASELQDGSMLLFDSTMFDKWEANFNLRKASIGNNTSTPRNIGHNCATNLFHLWSTRSGISGSPLTVEMVADSGPATFLLEDNCDVKFKLLAGTVTPTSSASVHVNGRGNIVKFDASHTAVGTLYTLYMAAASKGVNLVDLLAYRKPQYQPSGALKGIVRTLDMAAQSGTTGTFTLTYTAVGTTLAYQAVGDGAPGTPVNVGTGGWFTLRSSTATKWLTVWVDSTALPVGNVTDATANMFPAFFDDQQGNQIGAF